VSSNHKAPLAAFVVVAIACVVVIATNGMRSYARLPWVQVAAPVVNGARLLPIIVDRDEAVRVGSAEDQAVDSVASGAAAAAAAVSAVHVGPSMLAGARRHRGGAVRQPDVVGEDTVAGPALPEEVPAVATASVPGHLGASPAHHAGGGPGAPAHQHFAISAGHSSAAGPRGHGPASRPHADAHVYGHSAGRATGRAAGHAVGGPGRGAAMRH